MLAAPKTREEESAGDRVCLRQRALVAGEHGVEVFGGGAGVAEVKADAHALLEIFPDSDSSTLRVDADEVPDQEITHLGLLLELVHSDAQEERCSRKPPITLVKAREQLLQGREGRSPVELVEDVRLAARNPHQLTNGLAALRYYDIHDHVTTESDAYDARGMDLAIKK